MLCLWRTCYTRHGYEHHTSYFIQPTQPCRAYSPFSLYNWGHPLAPCLGCAGRADPFDYEPLVCPCFHLGPEGPILPWMWLHTNLGTGISSQTTAEIRMFSTQLALRKIIPAHYVGTQTICMLGKISRESFSLKRKPLEGFLCPVNGLHLYTSGRHWLDNVFLKKTC